MSAAIRRIGGRVLIVDAHERVLLVHERLEDGSTHWLTPGGGIEGGEQPRDAAVRESAEEVGIDIVLPADAEAALVTRRLWSWDGVTYDQTDYFYLARVRAGLQVSPRGLTEVERRTLLGFAWWTVPQLRNTSETLLPSDLDGVLAGLLTAAAHAG
ncbi:MAG: NUDIX domain-containing protein [Actinomycetota bacterium]|nr:NUDIX domain-containing protein [Actinomycetota bacterium]